MKGQIVQHLVTRALAAAMVASLIALPFAQASLAASALLASGAPAVAAVAPTGATAPTASIPSVSLDTTFTPLARGSSSPWDGEVVLDGIDGVSYNTPGTEVKVRATSSNAAFVDEVWLVYPRVQYLFTNKDVQDFGGGFQAISFSNEVSVGTFPPGTEVIFGIKTGVGIFLSELGQAGNQLSDQCGRPGAHCYRTAEDPGFVPIAPDPLRVCALSDDACRNKAWPSTTPDGKQIFYTGPGLRNVKDNSPHGRFQYLANSKADGTGTALTNTALFGLEDVGAPVQTNGLPCPAPSDLKTLVTTSEVAVSPGVAQIVGLSSVSGLAVGGRITITQPFQRETVTILGIDAVAKTIRAVFADPDSKPYLAGTNWAPEGCDWHPDFQDAGVVVWPALAATCTSTTVKDRVAIVGQEGYGTVTLRDATVASPFAATFKPGDEISFTVDLTKPVSVSGASPSWTINLHGQALMRISDPFAPDTIKDASGNLVPNTNKTLDAGLCYDPQFPPPPIIPATISTKTCAAQNAPWDFTISGVTAQTAPPSIRVTFTNDQTPPADESLTIQLASVGADGIAHYKSDLFTSLRVVSATTTKPSATWTGTFSLTSGPCPEQKTADLALACATGLNVWDITVTGTTQLQAPATVHVTWKSGATADVPLSGPVDGGVAHYRTTANLDQQMTSATAHIQGAWSGTFTVNGVACPQTKTISAALSCALSSPVWGFALSGVTAATAPASIAVTWAGGVTGTATLDAVNDGVALYTTSANPTLTLVGASATVPADWSGTFTVAGGPSSPCPPPPPPPGACVPIYNPAGKHIPNAGDNPRSGQNPDGFYHLLSAPGGSVRVKDTQSPYVTPAWPHGTTIKLAEANGRTPTFWVGPGSIDYEVRLKGDAEIWIYTNPTGTGTPANKITCYVPNPPKAPPSSSPSPSPSTSPSPSASPSPSTPPTIHVKRSTLTDHECDQTEWHFVITQVTSETAPSSVHVYWANGQDAVVPLEGVTGGTAHYRTTLNLDSTVTDATAVIAGSYGQFNLSHGPCPASSPSPSPSSSPSPSPSSSPSPSPSPSGSPSPSPSTSPSPSPTTGTVHVKTSTLTDHSCDSTSWHLVITNVTSQTAPAAILVYWTDGRQGLVLRQSVSGGTAHYRTTLNLTRPVTDAVATVAAGWSGQFNVSSGPCFTRS